MGVSYDELREGDVVIFGTELISRERASSDTIQNGQLLLPYGEQQIIPPDSSEAIELQNKISAEFIVRLSQNPTDLYQLNAKDFEEVIAVLWAEGSPTQLTDFGVWLTFGESRSDLNHFRLLAGFYP